MPGLRIDSIELRVIELPYKKPSRTSIGTERSHPCVIVKVNAGGLSGYGECVASQGVEAEWAFYSYETVETAWHILRDFLTPAALGMPLDSVEPITRLGDKLRGHPMARAGLEAAVWDVLAQAQGLPLADALRHGQAYPQPRPSAVETGVSIGIQSTIDETIRTIAGYRDEGYRRIKLKIEPGWDVDLARAVRQAFPDIPLMLDANSAYTLADAPSLRQLDAFGLMLLEQPLEYDDIYEHSLLQKQLATPLCLDESIHTVKQAEWAYELGACGIINIKPGRVGGLAHARAIHNLSLQRGKPVWIGGMLETGIGRAANIALASLPGVTMPGDISASSRFYEEDIIDPPIILNPDSTVSVPTGSGLGVHIRQDRLQKATQRVEILKAE